MLSGPAAPYRVQLRRAFPALTVIVLALATSGCGHSRIDAGSKSVVIPAELPPSPTGWPRYPSFSARSCWTRPFGTGVMRAAPSIVPARPMPGLAPEELVRRLLRRLGDRRFIRTVELGSPPPVTFLHRRGYYAGGRPPKDALWAYIAAPAATATLPAQPRPQQVVDQMIAQWETSLVQGALRDDFCAAGGRSLVGSTAGRGVIRVSDRVDALEQQFPSPSPAAFRRRVDLVGRRYGFRVDSLRLLRPRQLAPLLVVETDRDRKAFVRDLPAIMKLLDPISSQAPQTAVTFEGFLLAARDRHSPFVSVENVYRGEVEGGQWSWNRCAYPYAHSEPLGAKPCP